MLHSVCQQIWETQQWPQDWKRLVFILIPKKGNVKECSNYHTVALISHTSKVMFKILQARLQPYLNHELSDVQAGFRKGRGTRNLIVSNHWIHRKSKGIPEKHLLLLYWLHQSLVLCGSQQTGKFLKRWEYQTTWPVSCKNLCPGQEATVRTGHGTTHWLKIRTGVRQSCILSPCLFNLYAEYIMWNARLDEA